MLGSPNDSVAAGACPAPACPPDLPAAWHAPLAGQLAPGERVLDWLALNLDGQLRYDASPVVLTDRR